MTTLFSAFNDFKDKKTPETNDFVLNFQKFITKAKTNSNDEYWNLVDAYLKFIQAHQILQLVGQILYTNHLNAGCRLLFYNQFVLVLHIFSPYFFPYYLNPYL